MGEFWKIIQVILISSVKFVAGPPFAYFDQRYDFSFFETVIYCIIGGMLGVTLFTFFSEQITRVWHFLKRIFKNIFKKNQRFSEPVADIEGNVTIRYEYIEKSAETKKIFTKKNRKIVTIWRKYGLIGIAFLTPVILSIPIGTIIANNLVDDKRKIFLYMFVSILFWSLFMTSLFEIFHANTVPELQEQITK
jgi:hypothetical protein